MAAFIAPPDYHRIRLVHSFEALVSKPFGDGCNAICWQRTLAGDFEAVARELDTGDAITTLDGARLSTLPMHAEGRLAIAVMVEDLRRLRTRGHEPVLECVREYARDDPGEPVPTDVYSFHVDRAPVATDTFLCSYTAPASEGLRNDEACRRVDLPAIRARLLERFGGEDDEAFRDHLAANCFDLHYAPLPTARPFSFGVGNLWRIAVQYPGSPVPACIHRAPATQPQQGPRLLLIS